MINVICGALMRAKISTCNKYILKDETNNIIVIKLSNNFKNNTELTIIIYMIRLNKITTQL